MTSSYHIGRTLTFLVIAFVAIGAAAASSAVSKPEMDEHQRRRRASSFVRIGKSPTQHASDEDDVSLTGLNNGADFDEKRASSFVRIGKSSLEGGEQDLLSSYEHELEPLKRASSFVRIGRQSFQSSSPLTKSSKVNDDFHRKRMSSFVRIGKMRPSSEESSELPQIDGSSESLDGGALVADKKASSFIRIGRRSIGDRD